MKKTVFLAVALAVCTSFSACDNPSTAAWSHYDLAEEKLAEGDANAAKEYLEQITITSDSLLIAKKDLLMKLIDKEIAGQEKGNNGVAERVDEIYTHVFRCYIDNSNTSRQPEEKFDSLYLSNDFYELILKAEGVASQKGEVMAGLDYDHWVNAQDWDKDLSYKILDVTQKTANRATVGISIDNGGTDSKLTICLVRERGNWFIDDFNDMRKTIMRELKK